MCCPNGKNTRHLRVEKDRITLKTTRRYEGKEWYHIFLSGSKCHIGHFQLRGKD
jgi:hypothetical protein